jgi:hypothetical protein
MVMESIAVVLVLLAIVAWSVKQMTHVLRSYSPIYKAYCAMKRSPLKVKRVGTDTSSRKRDDLSFIVENDACSAQVLLSYYGSTVIEERIRVVDPGDELYLDIVVRGEYDVTHGYKTVLRSKELISLKVNGGSEIKDQLEVFERALPDQIRAELMSVANPVLLRFNEEYSQRFPLIKMRRRVLPSAIVN